MHEEEQNLNDIERRLQAYFRAEDQELDYPSGLWGQLAPRLGEQRRRGWVQRVLAISWIIPTWPPTWTLRILEASRARQAMAASMAFLFLIGIGYLGVTLARPSEEPMLATAPSPVPLQTATGSPPETGDSARDQVAMGQEIFTGAGGCSVCHTIEGISIGTLGPDLTHIGTVAPSRTDVSAEDYINESIRNPGAFVVEGFLPGLMPPDFEARLGDQKIGALVQFLMTQE